MTELGHNTPLGRGGSLLTVVIILTRPVKPANVSRADGRAGWAVVVVVVVVVVGSFCVFLLLHRPATGAERPATTPTEVDSQQFLTVSVSVFVFVFVFGFGFVFFVSVFAERNRSGLRTCNSSLLPWNVADPGLSCDKHDSVSDIGRTKICFSNHTRY